MDPVVHGLGLYALVIYGVTYYAIGAAAPAMARDLGTTTSAVFAILGAALLCSALMAPYVGRLIDRAGAGPVLLWGGAARAACVGAMALAPDLWTFGAAMMLVQVLSQATEYDAAFAAAVQARGEEARSSVSLITVWGGLASTAFWPLTSWLMVELSWRTMFVGYSAVLLCVSVVVGGAVILQARTHKANDVPAASAGSSSTANAASSAQVPIATRAALFLPIVAALALSSIPMGLPVILPPVLDGLSLGAGAMLVGVLFGPAQTVARFIELVFGAQFSPLATAVAATALLPISLLILVAGGAGVFGAIVFAVLFGAANGVAYVVRGTVVLQVFGATGYASVLGRIARIRLIVSAATPFVLATLLEKFGAVAALSFCALAGVLATLCLVHAWRQLK